jgi:hypothetical protein
MSSRITAKLGLCRQQIHKDQVCFQMRGGYPMSLVVTGRTAIDRMSPMAVAMAAVDTANEVLAMELLAQARSSAPVHAHALNLICCLVFGWYAKRRMIFSLCKPESFSVGNYERIPARLPG